MAAGAMLDFFLQFPQEDKVFNKTEHTDGPEEPPRGKEARPYCRP